MRADSRSSSAETLPQQYRVLLEIADAITAHQDVSSLLKDLAARLQHVVEADGINVLLYDEARQVMRLHSLASAVLPQTDVIPEMPLEEAPAGWVWQNQQPLLMNDLAQLEARYPKIVAEVRAYGIQTAYAVPLTSAGRRLGVLGFGSRRANAYNEEQQAFLQQVGKLVAVAVDNTLNFEHARQAEAEAKRRSEELQLLLEINNAVVSTLDLRELLQIISPCLRRVTQHDFAAVLVYDPASDQLRAHALELPERALTGGGVSFAMEGTPSGLAFRTRQPVLVTRQMLDQFGPTPLIQHLRAEGVQSGCSLPLLSHDRALGVLSLMSLQDEHFSAQQVELLAQIAGQIAIAVENSLNYERTRQAEQELARKLEHLRLMLKITNAVVSQLELKELLHVVSANLCEVLDTDSVGVGLFDQASGELRIFAADYPAGHPFREEGVALPLEGSPSGLAFTTGQPVFMDEPDLVRFPAALVKQIYERGYQSGGSIPLIAQGRKLGVLGFASKRANAFSADDKELLIQVANQVAIAVDNALNFERARKAEQEVKRQLERERLMLAINNAVVTQLDLRELVRAISACLREVLRLDVVGVSLYDAEADCLRAYFYDLPDTMQAFATGTPIPLAGSIGGLAFTTGQPVFFNRPRENQVISDFNQRLLAAGTRSGGCVPLIMRGHKLGVLGLASFQEDVFPDDVVELLTQLAEQVAIAVENALNYERARKAEQEVTRQLERERLMLEINNTVVTQLDLRALARVTATRLREVLHHDVTGISLYDTATNQFRAYLFDLPDNLPPIPEGMLMPLEGTVGGLAFHSGRPVFLNKYDPEFLTSEFDRRLMEAGIRSGGVVPLIAHDKKLGFLGVGSFHEDAFSAADQELLCHIANQIAIAVENALNFERAGVAEEQANRQSDRVQLLLRVNNATASALDLSALFRAVSESLRGLFRHDFAVMGLYDEQKNELRAYALERVAGLSFLEEGMLVPLDSTPAGLAVTSKQVVILGAEGARRFSSDIVQRSVEQGLRSSCSVPLLRQNRVIGAMTIASKTENAFTQADGELLMQIAGQIAIAVENALNYERVRQAEEEAKRQSQRRQLLLEINNAMVAQLDLRSLLQVISASLRRLSRHDVVGLALYDPDTKQLRAYAYDSLDQQFAIEEGTLIPLESSLSGSAFTTGQPIFHDRIDEGRFQSDFSKRFRAAGLKSGGVVPLIAHGRKLGTLAVASYPEANLNEDEKELLCQVANQVALAVENALAFREIEALKNKLTSEKLYLEDEIRTQNNFEELVGDSQMFRRILKQVETVAPTDSTVLIRGETGTGKELIARAIHHLSTRRERTLVKINCAAIPTGLLESELFGHEKGAFTGAIAQRIGRFELANHGTLLLDEVGDIPLELQSKLLRVLQEQEFERLGSTRTQRVDVRLIAATNCDLEQMVAERKYRSDLYYRLNVFPITIPPLRQRREDIPALTRFFTQKYARRLKKPITAIPSEAMAALTAYHWPGNVRELEH
ncbi:MAG: GAF domain-containing protein, partial [Acidobacteria bacterium]|nr:GAF domain-containing protein [Acidobacteriota bacterium]